MYVVHVSTNKNDPIATLAKLLRCGRTLGWSWICLCLVYIGHPKVLPFILFHETLLHPTIEILLAEGTARCRRAVILAKAAHVSEHRVFAFAIMV